MVEGRAVAGRQQRQQPRSGGAARWLPSLRGVNTHRSHRGTRQSGMPGARRTGGPGTGDGLQAGQGPAARGRSEGGPGGGKARRAPGGGCAPRRTPAAAARPALAWEPRDVVLRGARCAPQRPWQLGGAAVCGRQQRCWPLGGGALKISDRRPCRAANSWRAQRKHVWAAWARNGGVRARVVGGCPRCDLAHATHRGRTTCCRWRRSWPWPCGGPARTPGGAAGRAGGAGGGGGLCPGLAWGCAAAHQGRSASQ